MMMVWEWVEPEGELLNRFPQLEEVKKLCVVCEDGMYAVCVITIEEWAKQENNKQRSALMNIKVQHGKRALNELIQGRTE